MRSQEMSQHDQFAVWSTMKARPGKEDAVRDFLKEAARRLGDEPGTSNFFAMELGEGGFAIFNLFADRDALAAHIGGETAAWVRDSREELFVDDYAITKAQIFATKLSEMSAS